ncbi:class I SAM-dependent methyltransferase [Minwuia sp.]|uniref:class I SAM-dependent methyltransferase n=1 Tax=Minwuia sp. TaxID=2493630 RepID=UPI003A8D7381
MTRTTESSQSVSNDEVRSFWDGNPVAAEGIAAEPGTPEFYARFDAIREDDDCEAYDYSDMIHGYSTSAGKRVLDVGCGNGYVLSRYAMHGAEVEGVDITPKAIELSRRRFELAGLEGSFQTTDGEKLPFPDNHFDIACSMGVLHHIEDPSPMVAEMYRVLKPGGKLIAMLYYRYSWKTIVIIRLKRLVHPKYRGKTQQQALNMNDGDDCPLALVYSKAEAKDLFSAFERHRFRLNQLSWKQLLLIPPLARLLKPVLPRSSDNFFARRLGWNLYIEAYKPLDTTSG